MTPDAAPGPTVALHRLGPGEWRRLRELRLRALRSDPGPFWLRYEDEVSTPEAEWRDRLGGPATLVASLGGADVGLLSIGPNSWDSDADPRDYDLGGMWVAPEARGTGTADALIRGAADYARAAGARRVTLWVFDDNARAVRLYERLGFAATGRAGGVLPPEYRTSHQRALTL